MYLFSKIDKGKETLPAIVTGSVARSGIGRDRVDDGDDFVDPGDRKARQPGMLPNVLLAFADVDAERIVRGDVRVDPLHFPGQLGDGGVRGCGKVFQLGAAQAADSRDVSF